MNIFQEALQIWKDTWKTNKQLFWAELIGTVIGVVSAVVIDTFANKPPMTFILLCYFSSAILLSYTSYIRKNPFMFLLMGFYSLTSVFGLSTILF